MNVELEHPYEQMAEQLMYAKKVESIAAAIELAISQAVGTLSEKERSEGLSQMLQAGLESGTYPGDPVAEILLELRSSGAVREHGGKEAA